MYRKHLPLSFEQKKWILDAYYIEKKSLRQCLNLFSNIASRQKILEIIKNEKCTTLTKN